MSLKARHPMLVPMNAFGVVAIGRNEGERLKRCLQSVSDANTIIYVDSGSSDGSAQWARDQGLEVVALDITIPFTASRARNAGFKYLRKLAPELNFVQFIDADCELNRDWPGLALCFLAAHSQVAAVCGRLRERFPDRTIYNWLCDREWDGPVGEIRSCAGNVMMRAHALEIVGGYREDVIAGEEYELSVRLRAAGWRSWRIGIEMALHDAAMTHFSQWWRRTVRAGYAFAQGAFLHGAPPERHFVWESRRAWAWGIVLPIICLLLGITFGSWAWTVWLIYPVQLLRQTVRNTGSIRDRAMLALFQILARFPEGWGQIKFALDRLRGRQAQLIEYK